MADFYQRAYLQDGLPNSGIIRLLIILNKKSYGILQQHGTKKEKDIKNSFRSNSSVIDYSRMQSRFW